MATLRRTLFLGASLFLVFLAAASTHSQTTFGPEQIITTSADYAFSVFAADLDGDGDQDVLSAFEFDDKIAWYENMDGEGTFGEQQVITTLPDGAIVIAALDGRAGSLSAYLSEYIDELGEDRAYWDTNGWISQSTIPLMM